MNISSNGKGLKQVKLEIHDECKLYENTGHLILDRKCFLVFEAYFSGFGSDVFISLSLLFVYN